MGTFAEFPIRFIVEFYRNHGMLSLRDRPAWRVIEGGSRTYVDVILHRFAGRLRAATPIKHVRRFPDRVEIAPQGRPAERFDHVVFACHADQALRLLTDPSETERELLSAFPYEKNLALLHTDESVLPRRRRAWACWNYRRIQEHSFVTYNMNQLQHIRSRHAFNVTLNGERWIDPARILGQYVYEHPVFTARRGAAQARHGELINANRTSYCGAYWRNGFHEDGVVSALAVCEKLLEDRRFGSRRPEVAQSSRTLSPATPAVPLK
jgi:predicted NAD/FAD-binding protein